MNLQLVTLEDLGDTAKFQAPVGIDAAHHRPPQKGDRWGRKSLRSSSGRHVYPLPLGEEMTSTMLDWEREANVDRPMSVTAFPPLALPSSGSAVGGRAFATLSAR
jgi:hypothetical protein